MIEKSKFYYYYFCTLLWFLATWNFVIQEALPGLMGLESLFRLLVDAAIILLGLMTLRDRRDKFVILVFFIITFVSSICVNKEGLVTYANGVREYVGLLFMAPVMRYMITNYRGDDYIRSIDRQILLFLALQLIAIPFQSVKYGIGDHGGGTLGDGLSGTISTLIYIGTFYLVSRRWNPDDYLRSLRDNWGYFVLLIPSFLNETKISFIYFVLFFLLLFSIKLQSLYKLLFAVPLIGVVLGFAFQMYLSLNQLTVELFTDPEFYQSYLFADDADRLIEFSENYQDGDYYQLEDQWAVDMPRFFKIMQIPNILSQTKGGMILGAGVGQVKGGSVVDKTPFAVKNEIWFRGTIPMLFDLIVQMGLVGLAWFVWAILTAVRIRDNSIAMSLNVKVYMLMIIFMQMFYGTLLTQPIVAIFFFYIMFRNTPLQTEYDAEQPEVSHQTAVQP